MMLKPKRRRLQAVTSVVSGRPVIECSCAQPRRKMAESGETQANNPLSRKLNKILETRLDNDKVGAF